MSLNFPLLLVIAVFVCGLLGLIDLLFLAPRRRAAIATYQGSVSQPEPAVVERLTGLGFEPGTETVAELERFIPEDVARNAELLRIANFEPQ